MPKSWCPLESNPDVITKFAHKLGLDESLAYCDIFSTEDWALESVPRPVYALMLLFPVKDESEQFLEEEKKQIETNGQILSDNVYFTKQIVGNACGTIAVLHSILNLKDKYSPSSYFDRYNNNYINHNINTNTNTNTNIRFYKNTVNMNADERAVYLEEDEELETNHVSAAEEGQSEVIAADADVNNHFICFSQVDSYIHEY